MSKVLTKIWRGESRHQPDARCHYELSKDEKTIKVTYSDTFSYHFTKKGDVTISVEPSGGLSFSAGTAIRYNGRDWVIRRIASHTTQKTSVIFVFDVELEL